MLDFAGIFVGIVALIQPQDSGITFWQQFALLCLAAALLIAGKVLDD